MKADPIFQLGNRPASKTISAIGNLSSSRQRKPCLCFGQKRPDGPNRPVRSWSSPFALSPSSRAPGADGRHSAAGSRCRARPCRPASLASRPGWRRVHFSRGYGKWFRPHGTSPGDSSDQARESCRQASKTAFVRVVARLTQPPGECSEHARDSGCER